MAGVSTDPGHHHRADRARKLPAARRRRPPPRRVVPRSTLRPSWPPRRRRIRGVARGWHTPSFAGDASPPPRLGSRDLETLGWSPPRTPSVFAGGDAPSPDAASSVMVRTSPVGRSAGDAPARPRAFVTSTELPSPAHAARPPRSRGPSPSVVSSGGTGSVLSWERRRATCAEPAGSTEASLPVSLADSATTLWLSSSDTASVVGAAGLHLVERARLGASASSDVARPCRSVSASSGADPGRRIPSSSGDGSGGRASSDG